MSHAIIESSPPPPRKFSPGRQFTGKNPPVNCRPGKTSGRGRSYNGTSAWSSQRYGLIDSMEAAFCRKVSPR